MLKRLNFNDGFTSEVTPSAIIPSGRSIYTGTDTPSNSLGNDGDVYLQANGAIYLKTSGIWNVDSTLLVDVVQGAQDAADNANIAAQLATDSAAANELATSQALAQLETDSQATFTQLQTDAANTLTQVQTDADTAVDAAIADFANLVFIKEKLDVVSPISANTWITIPNSNVYYTNKISVALNGMILAEGDDFELDTVVGPRTQIRILEHLVPTDRLTFTIYN